ncbi:hypothetical protein ILUMI_15064, partial [Ignelater luminosus]
ELEKECQLYLEKLKCRVSNSEDRDHIQQMTRDQHGSADWRELRRTKLTASNFGEVIKRKPSTHCHNLVKRLLYHKEINSKAVVYGRTHEEDAVQLYIQEMAKHDINNMQVQQCGLYIDLEHPYLGATPDRLLGNDAVIEIKCLPSLIEVENPFEKPPSNACFVVENGTIRLKRNHKYYFQVQGQLNITKKFFCDYYIY